MHIQLAQFGNVEKNENQFVIYDQPYEQIPAIVEALVQQNVRYMRYVTNKGWKSATSRY
ncbi:hypothetical protein [Geomicrobium sp. JCM 19055]|uniref:hypothetical protein n=1 Tax=Geomicrobium sp. JCM 19055 TaxID=1460649 RepID=UPI00045ED0C3|nr:hypothetical protein [Geomicrobium sp. JCM 19055]GAJ98844.1 hypothetical protein JCM19055_1804 [Geomicrobium sp. JCM 19055]